MTTRHRIHVSPLAGLPAMVIAGVVAMCGAQFWVNRTGQTSTVPVVAGLFCMAGAIASLVLMSVMMRGSEDGIVGGIVGGMMVRGSLGLAGMVAIVSAGLCSRHVAGGWVLYWYLTFLVVEVVWLARRLAASTTIRESQSC